MTDMPLTPKVLAIENYWFGFIPTPCQSENFRNFRSCILNVNHSTAMSPHNNTHYAIVIILITAWDETHLLGARKIYFPIVLSHGIYIQLVWFHISNTHFVSYHRSEWSLFKTLPSYHVKFSPMEIPYILNPLLLIMWSLESVVNRS